MTGRARRRGDGSTIPAAAEDLDAGWFTAALGPAAGGATVQEVEVTTIGTDIGFAGEVLRCRLRWDGDRRGPSSVIVKLPSANPKNRASAEGVGAYEREILVYRGLGGRLGIPMPAHLHSEMTPNPAPWLEGVILAAFRRLPLRVLGVLTRAALWLASKSRRRYVLVLEDIEDARPPRQADGGSIEDACVALEVLARFHAANWMDAELVERHPFIAPVDQAPRVLAAAYVRNREHFAERIGEVVDDRVLARLDRTQAELDERVRHMASAPWTVLHGDYRLDNVLFRPSGEVVVLDYQLLRHGRPAMDVAYFIATALEPGDTTDEDALLAHYHDALVGAGVTGYDLETLRADVEVALDLVAHSTVSFSEFIDTDVTVNDVSFADQMVPRILGWMRCHDR